MKATRSLRPLLMLLVPFAAQAQGAPPHVSSSAPELALLRHAYCASIGGEDVSGEGTFSTVGGIGAVVACKVQDNAGVAPRTASPAITLPPFTYAGAALYPPSGAVTVAAASPIFNTSCAADVYVKPISGLPAISHGTSTVSCVGYNSGRGISNNCSVSWVGPTDVAVGAEPYGGHVVVAFACQALKPGSIGTAMSLRYADATYSQWATSQSDVASAIGITIQ